ncbi:MAG: 4-alpha-glucanotransferase [Thermoleophilaceae bacterium]
MRALLRGSSHAETAAPSGHEQMSHRLHNHKADDVVYTGTHDHDTIRAWWESLGGDSRPEVEAALARAGIDDAEPWWALIRLAYASPGIVAMVQMQTCWALAARRG